MGGVRPGRRGRWGEALGGEGDGVGPGYMEEGVESREGTEKG